MRRLRHLLGTAILTFALVGAVAAGQYGAPLKIYASFQPVGRETKFVVTFRNTGNKPVEQLRIGQVGLTGFNREFCPAYRAPSISPGKSWTFNVYLRGHVDAVSADERIVVTGTYRTGSQSVGFDRRIDFQ